MKSDTAKKWTSREFPITTYATQLMFSCRRQPSIHAPYVFDTLLPLFGSGDDNVEPVLAHFRPIIATENQQNQPYIDLDMPR